MKGEVLEMKASGLINLPDKFDFISNINTLTKGMVYHAERILTTNNVKITWSLDGKRISEDKENVISFYKKIANGKYAII